MSRTDRAKASALDEISKEIIEQLQHDGRKPY
ncbi:MAG: AsnC family transcriptional regulator, partial [Actinobacteria bacterium]|nr:AsnC family transcriptional regulator [Actinomycetota bacterium]